MKPLQWRLLPCSLLLMTILLLVACGSDSTTGSQAAASSRLSQSSKPVTAVGGPVAPDFTVSTGQETAFSLSDHQGDVVILYFSFPG